MKNTHLMFFTVLHSWVIRERGLTTGFHTSVWRENLTKQFWGINYSFVSTGTNSSVNSDTSYASTVSYDIVHPCMQERWAVNHSLEANPAKLQQWFCVGPSLSKVWLDGIMIAFIFLKWRSVFNSLRSLTLIQYFIVTYTKMLRALRNYK